MQAEAVLGRYVLAASNGSVSKARREELEYEREHGVMKDGERVEARDSSFEESQLWGPRHDAAIAVAAFIFDEPLYFLIFTRRLVVDYAELPDDLGELEKLERDIYGE
jgi:hypothetical protein